MSVSATDLMTFDDIIAAAGSDTFVVPPAWGQGRASFGGLVGALLLHRLRAAVPGRVLRSLTVSFVGPVAPGEVSISTEVLRQGKSVTQAQARLLQDGAVQAVLLASFGESRSSAIRVVAAPAVAYGVPEQATKLPWIPGVVPDFTQHFDFYWHEGGLPFTGNPVGNIGGYVRFRKAAGALTPEHLTALVDAWPPAVIGMFTAPAPISSLTWTLEIVDGLDGLAADGWYRYRAETQHAADGYMHAEARLWSEDGRLLAISRQTVVVFA